MHFLVFILTKAFTEDNSTSLGKNLLCIYLESVFFFKMMTQMEKQNKTKKQTKQNKMYWGNVFQNLWVVTSKKRVNKKGLKFDIFLS